MKAGADGAALSSSSNENVRLFQAGTGWGMHPTFHW